MNTLTKTNDWKQDPVWYGNPSLKMQSYRKKMRVEAGLRKHEVCIYGGGVPPHEGWGHFTVEGQYTGYIPDCHSASDVMRAVEKKFRRFN